MYLYNLKKISYTCETYICIREADRDKTFQGEKSSD